MAEPYSFMNAPKTQQRRAPSPQQMQTMDMPKQQNQLYSSGSAGGLNDRMYRPLPQMQSYGGQQPGGNGGAVTPGQVGGMFQPMQGSGAMGSNSLGPMPNGKMPSYVQQPGGWNPAPLPQVQGGQGQQAVHGGGAGNFFEGGHGQIWNQDAFKSNDSPIANYISSVLPVAQFDQNNYQYAQDFNEAQRRYNMEYGATQNQNNYQQGLSTRQQQMAEWQARENSNQFNNQLDWTKQTDQWSRDLSQQGLNDTRSYQQGLIGNQGNLNNYQNQYWQGQNQNNAFANNATAQYQQGLLRNQGGELSLANRTQDQNNAFLYAQMAQQAQQQQAERENMQRVTAMQTYGRNQAPAAQWQRGWG